MKLPKLPPPPDEPTLGEFRPHVRTDAPPCRACGHAENKQRAHMVHSGVWRRGPLVMYFNCSWHQ
jgi:hypothetical protein